MSLTTTITMIEDRFRLSHEILQDEVPGQKAAEPGNRPSLDLNHNRARVYRAENVETGEPIALKILNRNLSKLPEYRSRFQRDAAIMCSFEHPHVVKTVASGITPEGLPYIAMEYLEGRTLATRIAASGPIPPAEMGTYLEQIASALDAAHARGIVHRDINPGSMMIVNSPSGPPKIKLLDFGLAKELAKPSAAETATTGKQTILGKASYLSPELVLGDGIDARSDVYAMGVTLYEALTGRLPFQGETDFQILLAQVNGNVPPFPRRWTNHPNAAGLEAVVLKALSKNPEDRPSSVGILASLFNEALQVRHRRQSRRLVPLLVVAASAATLVGGSAAWPWLAKWLP